jgi:hypothetical protein
MTAPEAPAQALRARLDLELNGVQATAQARERLTRTIAARDRAAAGNPRPARRLRPAVALPLVGALVATVIGAAVLIPAGLRADPVPLPPAGQTRPSISQLPTSPARTSPASTPSAVPIPARKSTEPPAAARRTRAERTPEPAATAVRDEPATTTLVPDRVRPTARR